MYPQPQFPQQPPTGIQVEAEHNPLAFLFDLTTPMVVIDGAPYRAGWGQPFFFPVAPGRHLVKVFFRYVWMAECGANSVLLDVHPGYISRIRFSMPSFVYAQGRIAQY